MVSVEFRSVRTICPVYEVRGFWRIPGFEEPWSSVTSDLTTRSVKKLTRRKGVFRRRCQSSLSIVSHSGRRFLVLSNGDDGH